MLKPIKKLLLLITIAATLFTSCKKCVDCTNCPENVTLEQTEICEENFDSKEDYNTAVESIEDFGCNCK